MEANMGNDGDYPNSGGLFRNDKNKEPKDRDYREVIAL